MRISINNKAAKTSCFSFQVLCINWHLTIRVYSEISFDTVPKCIHATGNLFVTNMYEIYSKTRGHFSNKVCNSCQTLSFVHCGIIKKINTLGIIWNSGSTDTFKSKIRVFKTS